MTWYIHAFILYIIVDTAKCLWHDLMDYMSGRHKTYKHYKVSPRDSISYCYQDFVTACVIHKACKRRQHT